MTNTDIIVKQFEELIRSDEQGRSYFPVGVTKAFLTTALNTQRGEIRRIIKKSRTVDETFGIGMKEEQARMQILVDMDVESLQ